MYGYRARIVLSGEAARTGELLGAARNCSELLGAARNCSELLGAPRNCSASPQSPAHSTSGIVCHFERSQGSILPIDSPFFLLSLCLTPPPPPPPSAAPPKPSSCPLNPATHADPNVTHLRTDRPNHGSRYSSNWYPPVITEPSSIYSLGHTPGTQRDKQNIGPSFVCNQVYRTYKKRVWEYVSVVVSRSLLC